MRNVFVLGFGQRKFLKGEQPAGIMHALIFWGFVVLLLQVITLFGRTWDANWHIPGFGAGQPLGPPFFIARDLLEASVIVGPPDDPAKIKGLPSAVDAMKRIAGDYLTL